MATRSEENAYPIAVEEWERIIVRIERCSRGDRAGHFQTIIGILAGCAISGVWGLISLYSTSAQIPLFFQVASWTLTLTTAVLALFCWRVAKASADSQVERLSHIVEDMKFISDRYFLPPILDAQASRPN